MESALFVAFIQRHNHIRQSTCLFKIYHYLFILSPPGKILSELKEIMAFLVWSNRRHYLKRKGIIYQ